MLGTLLYLLYVSIMSFITMVVYGVDKRKAVKEQSRVPEKGLFVLGFFGGSIGGIVGMIVFSHKTKHIYFWILNILFLLLQIAIFIGILLLEIKFIMN